MMSVWVSYPGPDLTAEDYDDGGVIIIGVAGTNANGDKPVRLSLRRYDPETGQYRPDEEGRAVEMTAAETRDLIARLTETVSRPGHGGNWGDD
jgi:hypothetical protein